jgi:hypothetical protein
MCQTHVQQLEVQLHAQSLLALNMPAPPIPLPLPPFPSAAPMPPSVSHELPLSHQRMTSDDFPVVQITHPSSTGANAPMPFQQLEPIMTAMDAAVTSLAQSSSMAAIPHQNHKTRSRSSSASLTAAVVEAGAGHMLSSVELLQVCLNYPSICSFCRCAWLNSSTVSPSTSVERCCVSSRMFGVVCTATVQGAGTAHTRRVRPSPRTRRESRLAP